MYNGSNELGGGRPKPSPRPNSMPQLGKKDQTREQQTSPTKDAREGKMNTDDVFKQNSSFDKKSVKILQRPSTARSADARLQPESEKTLELSAMALAAAGLPAKRGHRKKTLSLNPEEREALESLIENVIIVGLDDAAIDSDDSSDENNTGDSQDNHLENSRDGQQQDNLNSKVNSNGKVNRDKALSAGRDNMRGRARGDLSAKYSSGTSGKEGKKMQKDPFKNGSNRNNNGKDFGRNREMAFGNKLKDNNRKVGGDYQQQMKLSSPEEDKEKQAVAGMLGVNIYPAQLKVAIKHMDSLPPRFLRRLQTGQNRMGGSEPALQSLAELSSERENIQRVLDSPSSAEKDRMRCKQSQLQETKKSIRNLLCDLDQYTDEGVTTPIAKEMNGLSFPISEELDSVDAFSGNVAFEQAAPQNIYRQPHMIFNSALQDPQLNAIETKNASNAGMQPLPVYQHQDLEKEFLQAGSENLMLTGGFMPNGVQSDLSPKSTASSQNVAAFQQAMPMQGGGFVPYGMMQQQQLQQQQLQQMHQQQQHQQMQQQQQQLQQQLQQQQPSSAKKTNLKADAPEFVSNLYGGSQKVDSYRNTQSNGKPVENGIAFLPGAHNTQQNTRRSNPSSFIGTPGGQESVTLSSGQPYPMVSPTPGYAMVRNPTYAVPQMPAVNNGLIQGPYGNGMTGMNMIPYGQPYPMVPYAPTGFGGNGPAFSQQDYVPQFMAPTSSWNGDVAPMETNMPWYPNVPQSSFSPDQIQQPMVGDESGFAMDPQQTGSDGWAGFDLYASQSKSSLEVGRQRIVRLLNEGNCVMVILTGNPDGDKASMVRYDRIQNLGFYPWPGPGIYNYMFSILKAFHGVSGISLYNLDFFKSLRCTLNLRQSTMFEIYSFNLISLLSIIVHCVISYLQVGRLVNQKYLLQ